MQRVFLSWPWNSRVPEISTWNKDWGYAFGQGKVVQWPPEPTGFHDATIDDIADLVKRLHADAMSRTAQDVGGHLHSIKITLAGTQWDIPTAKRPIVLK